ncbi:MAG TPA: hypothetical protein VMV69_30930 [Pirellulales bacterium]|nr:hypothetical protein [Pirellulales bacterium]
MWGTNPTATDTTTAATPPAGSPSGNRGGPGRPRREVEAEYRDVTLGAVSLADWQRIIERTRDDALAGDRHAREWLARMLGLEPPARVAATDPDGAPLTFVQLLARSEQLPHPPAPEYHNNIIDVDALPLPSLEAESESAA